MKFFLITIVLFVFAFNGNAWAANYDEEINTITKQIEEKENNKKALEEELKNVNGEIQSNEDKLNKIRMELEDLKQQINSVKTKIQQFKDEIEIMEGEIEKKRIEISDKKEILSVNLRLMEKNSDGGFLFAILGADSFSEAVQQYKLIGIIAKQNETILKELRVQEQNYKKSKKELEEKKSALELTEKKLSDLELTIVKKEEEQKQILQVLEVEQKELLEHIQEERNAQKVLNQKIAEVVMKREREKLLKKQEEEEKRQQAIKENSSYIAPGVANNEIGNPMANGTYTFTSGFGYRFHPVYGEQRLHNGVDFGADRNVPLYAVGDGEVIFSGAADGYGNWIVLALDNGMYAIYGHMYDDQLLVAAGERVAKGQHISGVGSAGTSTGNHLHFSLATSFDGTNFNYVDPMQYIK